MRKCTVATSNSDRSFSILMHNIFTRTSIKAVYQFTLTKIENHDLFRLFKYQFEII